MEKTVDQVGENTPLQAEKIIQLVSFRLGGEEFGVDILAVQEIIRMQEITQVPNSPHYIEGVINLRGKVIPVINLRKRLGLGMKEYDKSTRIIVVEMQDKIVGFIVDSVSEVLRVPASALEPPPQMVGNVQEDYITAVGKMKDSLLILLDLSKVIGEDAHTAAA
ncbi:MAG: purine-binding chemotaxis protein CheW [Calditrichaeota bacterium]|nr:MAG: purine-binding chemotaxis protein CheW [Calditrichota bacterium]